MPPATGTTRLRPRSFVRKPVYSDREKTRRGQWILDRSRRQWNRMDRGIVDVSVVVPVCNEKQNLPLLVSSLLQALEQTEKTFECVFVDDHSTDASGELLRSLQSDSRIRVFSNAGDHGKSHALQVGFSKARGNIIVMIDADLQYPPEAIPAMLETLQTCDIVVANRRKRKGTFVRTVLSRTYNFIFGRMLLRLRVDVQSGLKAFRAAVLTHVVLADPSPWGFDYEFLYRARRIGYRLKQVDILFAERKFGESHVHPLRTGIELIFGALALRIKALPSDLLPFFSWPHPSEYRSTGFENTSDYLFLPEILSSKRHIYMETVSFAMMCAIAAIATIDLLSILTGLSPLLIISGTFALIYLALMLFKVKIVLASIRRQPLSFSDRQVRAVRDADLPMYTILIPLYKEAEVIPQIMEAMSRLDWPRDKLEILITLEEYDHETREAIERANPPAHVRVITLPNVEPKTKPKALNVAFLQTRGEFLVIYDAEILPDPDQLKKAYLAFRTRAELACVQTCLDHYNADQNWITKLFNAEFSFHYDLFLPGLQQGGYALPLSGHSTHFRRSVLEDIGAWDPYNLTEDCDIGIRLARHGHATDIINSSSREEATSTVKSWIAQRSRWMKGFIQTSIVHLRHPFRLKTELGGWGKFCAFLFIVPGSVIMNIVNLFYWALFGLWLVTHSPVIQTLFPTPVLYVSLFSFAVGNFLFMYLNLIGLYRRKRYGLVKFGLLSFFYWLLLGYAAVRAFVHLFFKPYQWEKTQHGKHLLTPAYAPLSIGR